MFIRLLFLLGFSFSVYAKPYILDLEIGVSTICDIREIYDISIVSANKWGTCYELDVRDKKNITAARVTCDEMGIVRNVEVTALKNKQDLISKDLDRKYKLIRSENKDKV